MADVLSRAEANAFVLTNVDSLLHATLLWEAGLRSGGACGNVLLCREELSASPAISGKAGRGNADRLFHLRAGREGIVRVSLFLGHHPLFRSHTHTATKAPAQPLGMKFTWHTARPEVLVGN